MVDQVHPRSQKNPRPKTRILVVAAGHKAQDMDGEKEEIAQSNRRKGKREESSKST